MAGLKGKSGPPGNMNAFKHGLAAIQKRRLLAPGKIQPHSDEPPESNQMYVSGD